MGTSATNKQVVIRGAKNGFDELHLEEGPIPEVGEHEVLVRLRAASLNYRDLIIPKDLYPFFTDLPKIAASDGAGEVIQVGSKVTKWKEGDKVVTLFNQGHQAGPVDIHATKTGLGGALDGTLRQYGAFPETGLVRLPSNLDFVEGATLTCAGLTAWNALYGLKQLKPGETVLVQGTGGVSLFALQFAKAAGARVIATTSSASKAELLKNLGADHVINYNEDKTWGETARKLTPGGVGVDHIIEVGGAGTLAQSLAAVKFEGVITIIGFLGGAKPKETLVDALNYICTVRGVLVGSRAQMEEMCAAVEVNNIKPVLNEKMFTLDTAREAYDYMWAKSHIGKIGIKIE